MAHDGVLEVDVPLHGKGQYILDAEIAVVSKQTSLHLGWNYQIHFPGKGRSVNRQAEFVELPFTIDIKVSDTVVADTLIWSRHRRGSLRGDGTVGSLVQS